MPALDHATPDLTLFSAPADATSLDMPLLRAVVLVRVACPRGATLTEVVKDFAPLVAHRSSPAEWRALARAELAQLIDAGLAQEYRLRITASDAGARLADQFLGREGATKSSWGDVRDGRLIAKALGLEGIGPTRLKALMSPDGLRAVILQKAFGISQRVPATPAKLRGALARVALERSFGDRVRDGLSEGEGFSASDGRLLAGQLARRPRDFGSDAKLIATLAAEAVRARQTDLDALRAAILRQLFSPALPAADCVGPAVHEAGGSGRLAPHDGEANREATALTTARVKPTLADFARDVNATAQLCAEGWPGNYKALISTVWETITQRHPEWDLSEVAFKCMLTEAHLAGHVELAGADLKSADNLDALSASEITYKNTVWHQIRVATEA